jgi:hypothetical protein
VDNRIEGTHQHAKSGRLYHYTAGYEVGADSAIRWHATVQQHADDEVRFRPEGTIAVNTPAAAAIAEQAVRDAVLSAIDAVEDSAGP